MKVNARKGYTAGYMSFTLSQKSLRDIGGGI